MQATPGCASMYPSSTLASGNRGLAHHLMKELCKPAAVEGYSRN